MDSLDDQECSHVIQTKQEYETLLDQRNRAKREKEETERAAAREISRVKQEAAHEADRAAQRVQAQIDDLLQQVERKTAEIADQRALNANLLRISRERANADRGLRPKKIHTGYVVVMSSEKEIRYKTGRNKLLTAKVRKYLMRKNNGSKRLWAACKKQSPSSIFWVKPTSERCVLRSRLPFSFRDRKRPNWSNRFVRIIRQAVVRQLLGGSWMQERAVAVLPSPWLTA